MAPMGRTSLEEMPCSLARTLDVAGEWWTPIILRDVFLGLNRFDQIQRNLGISRKVLTERLDRLVDQGVLERRAYQQRPRRYDYLLSEKGKELLRAFFVLLGWGDRWLAGDAGPPARLRHAECGEITSAEVVCARCGEPLTADSVSVEPGPEARIGRGTWELARLAGYDVPAGPRAMGS